MDDVILGVIWIAASLPFLAGRRFIAGDSLGVFYGEAKFILNAIARHQSIWWNPLEYGGLPVLADPQSLAFTPHLLVGWLTGSAFNLRIFDITTLACPLLGAFALRRYSKTYADTRVLPILGSAVFMLAGVATSRLQHVPQIVSYGLIPFQLLAFRTVCFRPTAWRAVLLAFSMLAALVNLNQVTFLSAFALLPCCAWHFWYSEDRTRTVLCIAGAGLFALAASSPLLAAILEFLPSSNRAELPLAASAGFSFPLLNLTSLALPGLFGILAPQDGFWAPTDLTQDYLYTGLIPIVILVVAAIRAPVATMPGPLFTGMAGAFFVFAMGVHTPLYPFLFKHVPGFNAFRRPADGAFLMNLFLSLSIGSHRPGLLRRPVVARLLGQVAIGLGLLVLGFKATTFLLSYAAVTGHAAALSNIFWEAGWRAVLAAGGGAAWLAGRPSLRRLMAPAMLIAAVADLLSAGRLGEVLSPPYSYNSKAQIFYGPAREQGDGTAQELQTLAFLHDYGGRPWPQRERTEILGGALGDTLPLAQGLTVTQGYNPMVPNGFARAFGNENLAAMAKTFSEDAPFYDAPLYRLLSLRYVLLDRYATGALAASMDAIRRRLGAYGAAHDLGVIGAYDVWELRDVLPKATLHTDSLVPAGANVGSCNLLAYTTSKLTVTCQTAQDASLVIGDSYAPGWTACVNGRSATVFAYSGIFRAVALAAGANRVTLRYQPVPFFRHEICERS